MTTICAVSDLHGYLPEIPETDILVIAGDICPLEYDRQIGRCERWIDDVFVPWAMKTPTKYRLFIGGNHDFALESNIEYFREHVDPEDIKFLHDSEVVIDGYRFYGLPWVPNLQSWAFYGDDRKLEERFGQIPDDTDVVISHGPPYGIADAINMPAHMHPHVGTIYANRMIERVKPKHFICGHIHEGYGRYEFDRTMYSRTGKHSTQIWNVAINDAFYDPINKPVMFTL